MFKVWLTSSKELFTKYEEVEPIELYNSSETEYETKVLNDVKDLLYKIEQRIYGMEVKIQDLQGSQNILEESLAYINKYLVEKN